MVVIGGGRFLMSEAHRRGGRRGRRGLSRRAKTLQACKDSLGVHVEGSSGVQVKESLGVQVEDSLGVHVEDVLGVQIKDSLGLQVEDSIDVQARLSRRAYRRPGPSRVGVEGLKDIRSNMTTLC